MHVWEGRINSASRERVVVWAKPSHHDRHEEHKAVVVVVTTVTAIVGVVIVVAVAVVAVDADIVVVNRHGPRVESRGRDFPEKEWC